MRLTSGGMALMVLQDESGITKKRTVVSNNDLIVADMVMTQLQFL
jgi:hypothetical protein